jgi:hypothetical protein
LVEADTGILLGVSPPGSFGGAAAGKTIQFNLRAWRQIGNCVKEAIAVTIQANDQLGKYAYV